MDLACLLRQLESLKGMSLMTKVIDCFQNRENSYPKMMTEKRFQVDDLITRRLVVLL